MRRLTRLLAGLAPLLSAPACAPGPARPPLPPEPVATLAVWAEDVWLDVLDREGTFHGRLAEEGIFQRFHPGMDAEYELDRRTGLFTPAENARWARSREGLRAAGTSISHPSIMTRADWRQAFGVTGGVDLAADYRRDHSLTDRRDHLRLGIDWREPGGTGWTLFSRLGVHFFKPSADVEVGARRGSDPGGGAWSVEVSAALLDAFSDAIFVGLGVRADEVEAHLDHASRPLAARLALERRAGRVRVEVRGGATTRTEARVTFPGTGGEPFDLAERVLFAGALVEAAASRDLSAAAWVRGARADVRHDHVPSGTPRLRVRERTGAAGLLLRYGVAPHLALEGRIHVVHRPEERTGAGGALEHRDREVFAGGALVRRPESGWTGRLALALLDRDAGVLLPEVGARNERLVTEVGWRFASGVEVTAGLRWDLGRLDRNTFDGGQLRLAAPAGR